MIRATVSLESIQTAEITFQNLGAELYCQALNAAGFEYQLPDAAEIWTDPDPKNRFVRDEQTLGDLECWYLSRSIDSEAATTDLHCSEVGLVKEWQVVPSDLLERTVAYLRHFYSAFGLDDWRQVNKSYAGEKGNIFGFSDREFRGFVKGVSEDVAFLSENWRGVSKILTDIAQLESLHAVNLTRRIQSSVDGSDLTTLGIEKRGEDSLATASDTQFEFAKRSAESVPLDEQFQWHGGKGESSLVGFVDLCGYTYRKQLHDQVVLQSLVGKRLFMVESDAFVAQTAHFVLASLIRQSDEAGIDDYINSDLLTDDVSDTTLNELLLNESMLNGALSTTFSIRPFVQRIGFPEEGLDPVGVVDQFVRANRFFRGWESGVGVVDYPSTHLLKSSEDSVDTQDQILHTVDYSRNLNSAFTLDDWRQVNKSYAGEKGNIFGFSDREVRGFGKVVSDELPFLISENWRGVSKMLTDDITQFESLHAVNLTRRAQSSVGSSDLTTLGIEKRGEDSLAAASETQFELAKSSAESVPLDEQLQWHGEKGESSLVGFVDLSGYTYKQQQETIFSFSDREFRGFVKGVSEKLQFLSKNWRGVSKMFINAAQLESLHAVNLTRRAQSSVDGSDLTTLGIEKRGEDSLTTASEAQFEFAKSSVESVPLDEQFGWHGEKEESGLAELADLSAYTYKKRQDNIFGLSDEFSSSSRYVRGWESQLGMGEVHFNALSKSESSTISMQELLDKSVSYMRHFHSAFGLDDWSQVNKSSRGVKGNIFGLSDRELREFAKGVADDLPLFSQERKRVEKIFSELARVESHCALSVEHQASDLIVIDEQSRREVKKGESGQLLFGSHCHSDLSKGVVDGTTLATLFGWHRSSGIESPVGVGDSSSRESVKGVVESVSTDSRQQRSVGKGVEETTSLVSHVGWHTGRELQDGASLTDIFSKSHKKGISDQITLQSSFVGKRVFVVESDAFVTETSYFLLSRLIELSDTVYVDGDITTDLLTDSVADTTLNEYLLGEVPLNGALRSNFSIRPLTRSIGERGDIDPVGVSDEFSSSSRYVRGWDDPVETGDSIDLVNSWRRPCMESVSTAEQIWGGIEKPESDGVAADDWIGKRWQTRLSSAIAIDDWVGVGGVFKEYRGDKHNIASVADHISRTAIWARSIDDGQAVGDVASIHFRRPLDAEQIGVGDAIDITLTSSVSSMMNSFLLNEVVFNQ